MTDNTLILNNIPKNKTSLRRTPSQKRSRERVDRMLKCATEIISEVGSDALRMSEVAERADVSIGSLYQYFPDKTAIIRTLAEHYNGECHKYIVDGLAEAKTIDELCDAFGKLFDDYYEYFLAEPVIRDIRTATSADKALRDIELDDSRANGMVLAEAIKRINPVSSAEDYFTTTFLIMNLGEATVRLAITVGSDEGKAIVNAYKHMSEKGIRGIYSNTKLEKNNG